MITIIRFVCCLVLLAVLPTGARGFDGKQDLICAPTDMFECARGTECQRATAEEINIPQFIHVEVSKKQLRGVVGGAERTAPIQNQRIDNGRLLIQGVEGGKGWTLLIDQKSGKLSGSVNATTLAGHPVAFSILGVCLEQ